MNQWSFFLALGCIAISNPVLAVGFDLSCNDGSKLRVSELYKESTFRGYPLGDLIQVEVKANNTTSLLSGKYRMAAAGTGSFGGRWVYTGPPGPDFNLLKSGRSLDWYLDVGGKPITCVRP